MQIHEVTQVPPRPGFVTNLKSLSPGKIASGFVQGLTGVNFPQVAPTTTPATSDKTKPEQGAIFLVDIGGMEYYKNYLGQWFEKPDPAPRYSSSKAFQITDPRKTATLEKQLPQAKTIYVKPQSPGDNVVFIPDPAGRTAKLAARRKKAKVPR